MDRITALKARRAGDIEAMEALVASVGEADKMTAEQTAEFDELNASAKDLTEEIGKLEALEQLKAAAARPAAPLPTNERHTQTAVPAAVKEPGLAFARTIRTLKAAGGNLVLAQQIAEANGDSGLFANQNVSNAAQGGFLVPEDVASEVIELLRPASVVTAMGPIIVPMPNGNMTMNRRATGANFAYTGEQVDAPATGYTYGQVKLSAKKLTGLIEISNDLLRASSTAVDRMIRDDVVADAGVAQDRYFLRGTGAENAPKGLRYQHQGTGFEATHVLTMTAAPDLAKVDSDLGRMELALNNANVPSEGAHWVGSPRTAMFLTNLRNANGIKVYPEMADGMLRRKPFHVTTQIPDNLGGGTESELMLVHPRHVVVGEHMGIDIAVSTEAAYKDASGAMQAAFSRDETVLRMILQHDIGLRHLPAVAILTGLTWAP